VPQTRPAANQLAEARKRDQTQTTCVQDLWLRVASSRARRPRDDDPREDEEGSGPRGPSAMTRLAQPSRGKQHGVTALTVMARSKRPVAARGIVGRKCLFGV